ncbi:choloylglycine hydrolase [Limosilactobacillus fastidiosus]|uniref:choloylglycine hydrolase n=1 Tax=Limosilactobacillus fastidiosus TaxID=2759855 RepID=A0A7W3U0M2_9LACO|nr:choloylglycine hydrolase [Limosilactobacillus fastidiosus]MBB1086480.1 choloylglycine hydrolase family protein [Limosilactobacillus fastidiosus]MCD7085168.1 choloylglycine hydrolase [Limosilactobacillus fastidiosus]MCD7115068.1 choloylglycine hydrolase [Limosilactobacillus fastidiosus]MCD7116248.1 choloylglycine hydrolase [Limosilactobacillus fastidiosus]
MCTSIIYTAGDSYFGRNLDLEISFGEEVVITPRDYEFKFRKMKSLNHHYAITGMAIVQEGYPLYFDGANEEGLGMAGLNFDGPCHYFPEDPEKDNVTPFEFIPYVLGQCKNVDEVKDLIKNLNLVNINFSEKFPLSPLHWLIADKSGESIVVESTKKGLSVYDNPVGVLTNNPEFPQQLNNLSNYQSVSPAQPTNTLAPNTKLELYSRGLGTHMLPGGMDSESRFVKETFTKMHSPEGKDELENVTNYFHLLHAVEQQKGLDEVAPNTFEYTIYSDGVDLTTGTFYYTTYENNQINAVKLDQSKLDSSELLTYPLQTKQAICYQD